MMTGKKYSYQEVSQMMPFISLIENLIDIGLSGLEIAVILRNIRNRRCISFDYDGLNYCAFEQD